MSPDYSPHLNLNSQRFTDSIAFFDNSLGWKSTQGGLSSIAAVTTDDNNMGGLFVRKIGGAASAMVHLQKLLPLLFHPNGAEWMAGHFRPLYGMAIIANAFIAAFYALYMDDLKGSNADGLPKFILGVLAIESFTLLTHLILQSKQQQSSSSSSRRIAVAMPEGKTPTSITSRIVARTVAIVSGAISLIMIRDLIFPGFIFDFIPRDDIYLEWTGAFLHSPPANSPEAYEQGLEAALFVGDKFVSQFMALHMLILVAYKFLTAFGIPYGNDGSGIIKCKMIWKTQTMADAFVLFLLRLFSASALTASLDLRWHLMIVGYETFILGK